MSETLNSIGNYPTKGVPTTIGIAHPLAELDGETVWAIDLAARSERPPGLTCVGCAGPMSLRVGDQRRPHFAHRPGTQCVSGETALHAMTIRAIAIGIARQASRHEPFSMAIVCDFCDAGRMADLARDHGLSVEENRALSAETRPDILVRSADGDPAYVVEVIVTHAPEKPALEAFRARNLPVIAVKPSWETIEGLRDGLEVLEAHDGLGEPGTVGLLSPCQLPRHLDDEDEEIRACVECGAEARILTLEVSGAPCWRRACSRMTRVLDVHVRRYGAREMIAAGALELKGIYSVAREMGVRLEQRYSKTAGTTYWMNVCDCNASLGDAFVYDGFSSKEAYEPDLATPVRRYELCRNGHWTLLTERPWVLPAMAERKYGARGTCGDRARIFDQDEPLVRVQFFEHPDDLSRQLARFMTWGRR